MRLMAAKCCRPMLRIIMALVLTVQGIAHAGPMGFKDSWMAMGDFGPNWREL